MLSPWLPCIQGKDVPHVERFPQPIMQWSGGIYDPVFSKYGDFRVRENGEDPDTSLDYGLFIVRGV